MSAKNVGYSGNKFIYPYSLVVSRRLVRGEFLVGGLNNKNAANDSPHPAFLFTFVIGMICIRIS